MRTLVSGVLSSWLTVEIRLLFTSSSSSMRVTFSRMTATPKVAPLSSRSSTMRGRK